MPYRAEARNNLARLYMNQERYRDAVREIRATLRYNARHAFARLSLGLCYHELGEEELFLQEMKRVLLLDPEGKEGREAAKHLREFRRVKEVEKAGTGALE